MTHQGARDSASPATSPTGVTATTIPAGRRILVARRQVHRILRLEATASSRPRNEEVSRLGAAGSAPAASSGRRPGRRRRESSPGSSDPATTGASNTRSRIWTMMRGEHASMSPIGSRAQGGGRRRRRRSDMGRSPPVRRRRAPRAPSRQRVAAIPEGAPDRPITPTIASAAATASTRRARHDRTRPTHERYAPWPSLDPRTVSGTSRLGRRSAMPCNSWWRRQVRPCLPRASALYATVQAGSALRGRRRSGTGRRR